MLDARLLRQRGFRLSALQGSKEIGTGPDAKYNFLFFITLPMLGLLKSIACNWHQVHVGFQADVTLHVDVQFHRYPVFK
jgi:hypothetical protein